ncbi:LOW QUALITY PROTEIN: uncharacterized protein WM294_001452 [Sarcoramphus papa]
MQGWPTAYAPRKGLRAASLCPPTRSTALPAPGSPARGTSPSLSASPSTPQGRSSPPRREGGRDGIFCDPRGEGAAPRLWRPASAPQAGYTCGTERWSPCGLCLRGRSPSSLGRRGTGSGPLEASSGPWLGAGQALLLESVFICIYFEQLPTWLSCGAGQLLEKHQGLGISSRNHLVPTDLTLHPLPGPGRTPHGLQAGRRHREGRGCLRPPRRQEGLIFKRCPGAIPAGAVQLHGGHPRGPDLAPGAWRPRGGEGGRLSRGAVVCPAPAAAALVAQVLL